MAVAAVAGANRRHETGWVWSINQPPTCTLRCADEARRSAASGRLRNYLSERIRKVAVGGNSQFIHVSQIVI